MITMIYSFGYLFANSVKELYKYLELEEINHFDDQRHLQNLKEDLRLL